MPGPAARRWAKLGHLFVGAGQTEWMQTHAAVPFAECVGDDIFHVYFSTRDARQRSHTARLTLELAGTAARVLDLAKEPVLAPGALGGFDDSGAMASWITEVGTDRYLYYIGWNRGVTVPFHNSTGLAISRQGGPFERFAAGPILDRCVAEPYFATNPCVLKDGDLWRMWYLSCVGWDDAGGAPRHRYHLKYAESGNGTDWHPDGTVAIDFVSPTEYAISRPCVIVENGLWRMWYSFRGDKYRIGYAESEDGVHWTRLDHLAGISVSERGWDSESVEYSHVFAHGGAHFMLYNGNDFGRTGFGIAIREG